MKTNSVRRIILVIFSVFTASVLGISSAQAYSVAFSYDGYGIRDWPSLGATYVSSGKTVKIVHNQTPDYEGNAWMAVHIEKQYWYGWKSVASVSYKNDARGKVSYHKISADGTYRLRFISDPTAYSFHVWGTFNK